MSMSLSTLFASNGFCFNVQLHNSGFFFFMLTQMCSSELRDQCLGLLGGKRSCFLSHFALVCRTFYPEREVIQLITGLLFNYLNLFAGKQINISLFVHHKLFDHSKRECICNFSFRQRVFFLFVSQVVARTEISSESPAQDAVLCGQKKISGKKKKGHRGTSTVSY